MDSSRSFITKIVDEGRINEVLRSGITDGFFNEDCASVYQYILRHHAQYRQVPARDSVLRAFPNFEFSRASEPLEYYIDQAKETFRRAILEEKLNDLADLYDKDSKGAETILRDTLSELVVTQKSFRDVNFATSANDRIQSYQIRKENPGANGILSGWAKLDNQTLGWQPGEFAVLVAEKYMGKSWSVIWMGLQAALQGEQVLIVTKEMTQDAVIRRMDSIYARVCFDSLRKGELTHIEEARYVEKMAELVESNLQIVVARQGVQTIEDIENKAVETDATIIFGDSIYLFDPDSRGRYSGEVSRRLAVSQRCKSAAQTLGIPFIVSVQAGRKKTKERTPDLDSIEWSNAFSQDGDTVVFLEKDDLDKELRRAHMYVLKARDGDTDDFFIHQDFETMDFSQRADESVPTTSVFQDDEEEVILNAEE